jgi:hypothetical protein
MTCRPCVMPKPTPNLVVRLRQLGSDGERNSSVPLQNGFTMKSAAPCTAGAGPSVSRVRPRGSSPSIYFVKVRSTVRMALPVRPGRGIAGCARIPTDATRLAPSTHPAEGVRSGCNHAGSKRAERRSGSFGSLWQMPGPRDIPSGSLRAPIQR